MRTSLCPRLLFSPLAQAFKQQQRIGKEVRDIRILITKVERQLAQYTTSLQHVHHALKQFGDIEHFLQVTH